MKVLKRDKKIFLRKLPALAAVAALTLSISLWGCQRAPESGLPLSSAGETSADTETDSPSGQTSGEAENSAGSQTSANPEGGASGQTSVGSEGGASGQDTALSDNRSSGPVTFSDSLGRQVTVENPKRVAAMIGSFADIWCLAGGKDSLVAAAHDTWTYFDLGLDPSVADIGNTKEPNLEILTASDPDFVIASSNTDADVKLLDTLESMGMNMAYFQVSNFNEYLNMLDICTQITGQPERFRQYGLEIQEQIDRAKSAADGSSPTVLYVRASGSSCKVKNSKGSVLGEMLDDLGCVNIADSEDSLLEDLNMEAILAADPDFIFVVLQGADKEAVTQTLEKNLLSQPAWQGLTAVQEGRYHILDDTLYNLKPNERWGEAYEGLARILYPSSQ